MDSAQTEQELRQRQGVAKEDTLPPVENKDLQYVPIVPQVLYAPPKISFFQKLSNSSAPFRHYAFVFLPEVIIFIAFLLVLAYAMNYFNFIPLSSMYPKIFGALPHRYNAEASKTALSDVAYSSEIDGYEIEGKLYKVEGDKVSIDYKGKIAEFFLDSKLICKQKVTRKISATEEETSHDPAFCSDILISKNSNKKLSITFYRTSAGYNIINYLLLE